MKEERGGLGKKGNAEEAKERICNQGGRGKDPRNLQSQGREKSGDTSESSRRKKLARNGIATWSKKKNMTQGHSRPYL